jgi:hypothetical protein
MVLPRSNLKTFYDLYRFLSTNVNGVISALKKTGFAKQKQFFAMVLYRF